MASKSITIGKVTEMTLINPIKPGQGPALRTALSTIKPEVVRAIETIHFARWFLIDDDTRLVFTSNFDGSWEDYMGDFVTRLPDGLDLIWSHCVDYPEAGCRDFPKFSAWVDKYQIPTTLWYAAYPAATVKDVIKALDVKKKADDFQASLSLPPSANVGQA